MSVWNNVRRLACEFKQTNETTTDVSKVLCEPSPCRICFLGSKSTRVLPQLIRTSVTFVTRTDVQRAGLARQTYLRRAVVRLKYDIGAAR